MTPNDLARVIRGTLTRRMRENADDVARGKGNGSAEAIAKTLLFDSLFDPDTITDLFRVSRHNQEGWGFRVDVKVLSKAIEEAPYYETILEKVKGFSPETLEQWYLFLDETISQDVHVDWSVMTANRETLDAFVDNTSRTHHTLVFHNKGDKTLLYLSYQRNFK